VYAANVLSDIGSIVLQGVGFIVKAVITLLGKLIALVLYVLIAVAQYNDFIYATAVAKGWGIVRDICNMFFVLVLLAIAAGTILQQEKYHYSRTLPKLILMAILINFSKTICGLIIDFAQVAMMTFVGAFSDAGPGNFMVLLGIQNLLTMNNQPDAANFVVTFISLMLAVVLVFIALVVVTIITFQLIIRIVALWFLVTLSPFAFFLSTFPQGEKYAAKWWNQFTNYVILGPVMTFFLWMSLAVTQHAADDKKNAGDIQIHRELGQNSWQGAGEAMNVGTSIAGTTPGIAGFMLGITMLLASLVAAQQLASVGGGVAEGALKGMKQAAAGTAQLPLRAAGGAARAGAGAAKKVGASAVQLAKGAPAALASAGRTAAVGAGKAGTALGSLAKGAPAALASAGRTAAVGAGKAGTALGSLAKKGTGAIESAAKSASGVAGGAARAGIGSLRSVGSGVLSGAATIAKTDFGAIGKAGVESAKKTGEAAKTKLQSGIQATRAGIGAVAKGAGNVANIDVGTALTAAGGALKKKTEATGKSASEFLKKDYEKTKERATAGVGAIKETAGKVVQKAGDINQATDVTFLAGKAKRAAEATGKSASEFLKKDYEKTKERAAAGVGAIKETAGKVVQKAGDINQATDVTFLAGKAKRAFESTEEYKGAKGLFGFTRGETSPAPTKPTDAKEFAFPPVLGAPSIPSKPEEKGVVLAGRQSVQAAGVRPQISPTAQTADQKADENKMRRIRSTIGLAEKGASDNEKNAAKEAFKRLTEQEYSPENVAKYKEGWQTQQKPTTLQKPEIKPAQPQEIPEKTGGLQRVDFKQQSEQAKIKKEQEEARSVTVGRVAAMPGAEGKSATKMNIGELQVGKITTGALEVGSVKAGLEGAPKETLQKQKVKSEAKSEQKSTEKSIGVQIADMNKAYDAVRMEKDSPDKTRRLEAIQARRVELEAKMKEQVREKNATREPSVSSNEGESKELGRRREELRKEFEQGTGAAPSAGTPTLRVSGFMPSISEQKPEPKPAQPQSSAEKPADNKDQSGLKGISDKLGVIQKQGKQTQEGVETLTRKFKTK
jgi:hypothetical protein